jgi:hypothetical protein
MDSDDEDPPRHAFAFNSFVEQTKVRDWQGGDWRGISLSEMWRAANLPSGYSPEDWAFLHRNLFEGMRPFVRSVMGDYYCPADVSPCPPGRIDLWSYGLLDCISGGGSDWMCDGDIITRFEPLAAAYAMFVDEAIDQADEPLRSLADDTSNDIE